MLELVAALTKLLLYAGSLWAAGAALAFATLNGRLGAVGALAPALIKRGAWVALVAVTASVIILVFRLGGELNGPTVSAIAETPAGPAILLQFAGAVLVLGFADAKGLKSVFRIAGAVALIAAFGVNGHSASVDMTSGIIVFVHVLAASWWIGALLLLQPACTLLSRDQLANLVNWFSMYAMAIVAVLLAAGVFVVFALIDFSREDWLTPYAQSLALKILLAVFLMSLAIWNKFRITPQLKLSGDDGVRALHHSIGIEIGIVASVLAATAWLTTFNSPHM
jgi:putative copper export protein